MTLMMSQVLDASVGGSSSFMRFPVGANTVASFSARAVGGSAAWASAVISIRWQLDPEEPWRDFATAVTLTTGTPYAVQVNCYGFPTLAAVVTTAESSVRLRVTAWAEGDV